MNNQVKRCTHNLAALLLGSIVLALIGCSSASAPIRYYSLAGGFLPAQAGSQVGSHQARFAIQIGPVILPEILKKSPIVLGRGDSSFQLSDQHRWSGELDRDLARAIAEQLAVRLDTEQIALFPAGQHFELTHQVVFDVVAMEGLLGTEARLVIRWSVLEPTTKVARLTRLSSVSEQPIDNSHGAWVAAQRRNIAKLSEEIATAIIKTP